MNIKKSLKENIVSKRVKKLTLFNVVAALFTSIFLVDALIPAAATGASTFIWYIIFAFSFYMPYALCTAEFASKYPEEGGLYVWVKKSLGMGAAKRVAWYYWINIGIWAPSISLYITSVMQKMWFPGYDNMWLTACISIIFMWASLLFAFFPISENKLLYNLSTFGKVLIVLAIFIGAFLWIGSDKPSQTNFMEFDFSGGAILVFLPALIYNILGLEITSGEISQVKNPKKTMPRAILIVTIALILFYMASTVALQIIYDATGDTGELALAGLIDAFENAFGQSVGSKVLINILGIIFMFTMFVETMGWVSGANAGALKSAQNKEIPSLFKKVNKKKMPYMATILLGIFGTINILLFTFIQELSGKNTVFWSLFGASSIGLFIAHIIIFISYLKLKWIGSLEKVEGFGLNRWIAIPYVTLATIVVIVTSFLLIWSPGYDLLTQTLPITVAVAICLLIGEGCFILANRQSKRNAKK